MTTRQEIDYMFHFDAKKKREKKLLPLHQQEKKRVRFTDQFKLHSDAAHRYRSVSWSLFMFSRSIATDLYLLGPPAQDSASETA